MTARPEQPWSEALDGYLLTCMTDGPEAPASAELRGHLAVAAPTGFCARVLEAIEGLRSGTVALACEDCEPDLSAWIDAELEAEREEAVILHLASCDSCMRELADLKELTSSLSRSLVEPGPIPADFAAQVVERAFAPAPAAVKPVASGPLRIGPRRWGGWLSAAAAVLVASLVGLPAMMSEAPPESTGVAALNARRGEAQKADLAADGDLQAMGASPKGAVVERLAAPEAFEASRYKAEPELSADGASSLGSPRPPAPGAASPKARADEGRSRGMSSAPELAPAADAADVETIEDAVEPAIVTYDVVIAAADIDAARRDLSRLLARYELAWEERRELRGQREAAADVVTVTTSRDQGLELLELLEASSNTAPPGEAAPAAAPRSAPAGGRDFDPAEDLERLMEARKLERQEASRAADAGARKAEAALDEVRTRDGWSLSGTIVSDDEAGVTLVAAGRRIHVPRAQVLEVRRAAGPAAPSPSPVAEAAQAAPRMRLRFRLERTGADPAGGR